MSDDYFRDAREALEATSTAVKALRLQVAINRDSALTQAEIIAMYDAMP